MFLLHVAPCRLCVLCLTQIEPEAQRAEPPQHRQLQLVGQRVRVDGTGLGADRSLPHQRGAQLGQNLFGHPPPQEVSARFTQRAQHLADRVSTQRFRQVLSLHRGISQIKDTTLVQMRTSGQIRCDRRLRGHTQA